MVQWKTELHLYGLLISERAQRNNNKRNVSHDVLSPELSINLICNSLTGQETSLSHRTTPPAMLSQPQTSLHCLLSRNTQEPQNFPHFPYSREQTVQFPLKMWPARYQPASSSANKMMNLLQELIIPGEAQAVVLPMQISCFFHLFVFSSSCKAISRLDEK